MDYIVLFKKLLDLVNALYFVVFSSNIPDGIRIIRSYTQSSAKGDGNGNLAYSLECWADRIECFTQKLISYLESEIEKMDYGFTDAEFKEFPKSIDEEIRCVIRTELTNQVEIVKQKLKSNNVLTDTGKVEEMETCTKATEDDPGEKALDGASLLIVYVSILCSIVDQIDSVSKKMSNCKDGELSYHLNVFLSPITREKDKLFELYANHMLWASRYLINNTVIMSLRNYEYDCDKLMSKLENKSYTAVGAQFSDEEDNNMENLSAPIGDDKIENADHVTINHPKREYSWLKMISNMILAAYDNGRLNESNFMDFLKFVDTWGIGDPEELFDSKRYDDKVMEVIVNNGSFILNTNGEFTLTLSTKVYFEKVFIPIVEAIVYDDSEAETCNPFGLGNEAVSNERVY